MKIKVTIFFILMSLTPLLLGYLPMNWFPQRAEEDVAQSDLIVVVRVNGLDLAERSVIKDESLPAQHRKSLFHGYAAEMLILSVLKTNKNNTLQYQPGSIIKMAVGGDVSDFANDPLRIDPASPALTMANTQNGFDLRIGQTYLLFLSRNEGEVYPFEPRSGPFSIYWLLPEGIYRRKNLSGFGEHQEGWPQLLEQIKRQVADLERIKAKGSDR